MNLIRPLLAWVTLTLLAACFAFAPSAHADSLPFSDQNATGSIGLCDSKGHPISSGSMYSHAFVTAAASSTAAPAGYNGGKATLYAFQPRVGVDPGEWSGFQLTGGSVYADAQHPLVSGTNLDPSLQDFISAYPARWDGLVQLRIYYTAPNKVSSRRSYPAAVLKVSGGTWSLVQGSQIACDLTKVVSSERLLLPASDFDPAHPAVTQAPAPAGVSTAPAQGLATGTAKPSLPVAASPTSSPALTNTAASTHESGSSAGVWWSLAVLAVIVLLVAGFMVRHRTRATR